MIELDVQSSEKGQGRESLQSPLVLLYSLVAIVSYYAITNTDYTARSGSPPRCLWHLSSKYHYSNVQNTYITDIYNYRIDIKQYMITMVTYIHQQFKNSMYTI